MKPLNQYINKQINERIEKKVVWKGEIVPTDTFNAEIYLESIYVDVDGETFTEPPTKKNLPNIDFDDYEWPINALGDCAMNYKMYNKDDSSESWEFYVTIHFNHRNTEIEIGADDAVCELLSSDTVYDIVCKTVDYIYSDLDIEVLGDANAEVDDELRDTLEEYFKGNN